MDAYQRYTLPKEREENRKMKTPKGYDGVEHADGVMHAIDFDDWGEEGPLWRVTPVCGTATGVSSDEGGPAALHQREITCIHCIAILA